MARIVTHAPDGGSIPRALCEEPAGDVSTHEDDVTCLDCLDPVEESDRTFAQLAEPIKDFWNADRWRTQAVR